MDEIFRLKALVCADGSKSRDWFDSYTLIRAHGYSMADFHRSFVDSGQASKYVIAKMRLLKGRPPMADEGYEQVTAADSPRLDDMRAFFTQQIDAFERLQFAQGVRARRQDMPR